MKDSREPLHQCFTKATTRESGPPRRSMQWLASRRARLKVFSDRLECGDWTIPYGEIQNAVLYRFRSMFFIPGYVLMVKTDPKTYQFGLNAGKFWTSKLPFPVEREAASLGMSPVSLAIRLILFAVISYVLWHRLAT